jgi:hypothetical protein
MNGWLSAGLGITEATAGSRWATTAAFVTLAAIVVVSELFRRHQQRGGNGGALSRPKQVWLGVAVYFWFLLVPIVALDPQVPTAHRIVFGVFFVAMGLRGPVELVMLYITKNWRPPYGIVHSAFCALVVGAASFGFAPALLEPLASPLSLGAACTALIAVLGLSLVVEVWHAAAFFKVVGDRTVGDDAVWFAPADDAAFAAIVRRTAVLNLFFVPALVAFLVAYAGGW